MKLFERLFGSASVDLHAIHQCTACGDFECHDAECVRREYKDRAQRVLRRLRERNDGERVTVSQLLHFFDGVSIRSVE